MVGRLAFGVVQMPGGWRSDRDAIRMRHSMSWEAAEAGSLYPSCSAGPLSLRFLGGGSQPERAAVLRGETTIEPEAQAAKLVGGLSRAR